MSLNVVLAHYGVINLLCFYLDEARENKVILTLPSAAPGSEPTEVHTEKALEAQAEEMAGWLPLPPGLVITNFCLQNWHQVPP